MQSADVLLKPSKFKDPALRYGVQVGPSGCPSRPAISDAIAQLTDFRIHDLDGAVREPALH